MSSSISENTAIHECAFKAYIKQTDTAVKFSCRMFVAWKNSANQAFCRTMNENVIVKNGVATFDEELTFQTNLLYDTSTELYLKKETSLSLMLVSTRKPGEEKLVGRVAINLADVLNERCFEDEMARELSFCSIKGSTLTFSIVSLWKKSTNMKRIEYDLNDFSIIANKLNQSEISQNEDFITFRPKVDVEQSKIETLEKEENIRKGNKRENEVKITKVNESEINNHLENEEDVNKTDEIMPHIRIHNIESEESETEEKTNAIIPKLVICEKMEGFNYEYGSSKDEMNEKVKKMYSENEKLMSIIDELNERLIVIKENGEEELRLEKEKGLQNVEQNHQIISKLRTELENKSIENEQLKLTISETNALVQTLTKEISINEIQNRETLEEMQAKLNAMTNDKELIKDVREEMMNKERILEGKLKELEESENIRLDFESEILEIRYELSELKTERINLKNELLNKEQHIKRLIQEANIPAVLNSSENEKKENITENEYESLTVKIVCLEQELRAVEDELTRYETQRISLENQVKELECDKEELLDQITIKELEMEEYKSSVNDRLSENDLKGKDNLALLEAAGIEIENLKISMAEKDRLMNKWVTEVNEEKIKFLSMKEELRAKEDEQTKILKEASKHENALNAEIESLNFKLHSLTNHKIILEAELSKKHDTIQQFEEQIQNSRTKESKEAMDFKNAKEIMEEVIREKEGELIMKNEEIMLLRNKLGNELSKAAEIEEKMNKFVEKEDKMRENIIILEEESKRVYDIVTEKEEQEEALIAEIEKLKEENLMLIDELEFASQQLHNYKQENGVIMRQANETEVMNNEMLERVQAEEEFIGLINQANRRNSELEYQIAIIDKRHLEEINKLETGISIEQFKNEEEKVKMSMLEEQIIELKNEREELKFKIETYELAEQLGENSNEIGEKLREMSEELERVLKERNEMEGDLERQMNEMLIKDENTKILEIRIAEINSEKSLIEAKLTQCEIELEQLSNDLFSSNSEVVELRNKLQEKQIKHNYELHKEYEHSKREENRSSELIANHHSEPVSKQTELINACKNLQELIHQRCEKDKLQTAIEFVLSKNVLLEQELNHTTEQRGTIQETARKLSMEFQMIKSKILKGKGSFQERTELISCLKPCELKVKELVEISERLCDFELEAENF